MILLSILLLMLLLLRLLLLSLLISILIWHFKNIVNLSQLSSERFSSIASCYISVFTGFSNLLHTSFNVYASHQCMSSMLMIRQCVETRMKHLAVTDDHPYITARSLNHNSQYRWPFFSDNEISAIDNIISKKKNALLMKTQSWVQYYTRTHIEGRRVKQPKHYGNNNEETFPSKVYNVTWLIHWCNNYSTGGVRLANQLAKDTPFIRRLQFRSNIPS